MSDKKYIVGVDLGGTSINVGVLPYDGGKVLGMGSMPTNSDHGAKYVVDRMVEMIRGSMRDAAREENISMTRQSRSVKGAPSVLLTTSRTPMSL